MGNRDDLKLYHVLSREREGKKEPREGGREVEALSRLSTVGMVPCPKPQAEVWSSQLQDLFHLDSTLSSVPMPSSTMAYKHWYHVPVAGLLVGSPRFAGFFGNF
ncbi:uncharacterized protein RSE6_06342 [Rhynchosporium secalis]|uniref:Uncharacterized protein n=1 Tax=Rhynchosporium secalis TaxID=38038 RepID=A0A1E1MA41_RHYSE|nr:uncharacterized protein RSE6_06342 [Rhynchosporium secalis]